MIFPLCACGFLVWTGQQRMQRVETVTNTDHEEAVVDAASPTGYAGGKRWLIVPEHNNRSYQWIAETQQMLARQEWRVRHVDYENAPFGREVHSASPYHWWLGLIARTDCAISGRPAGLAVERAALWADPLLHLLLLAGTTIFVARSFGRFPAALLALGLATIYPFAGGFLPGVPDVNALTCACALWSVLPILAATVPAGPADARPKGTTAAKGSAHADRRVRRFFLVAGVAGGCGLWVSSADQAPVVAGVAIGAMLVTWITRGAAPLPWRTWALAGASTCLLAYLVEYFPSHMELRLQVNHPLYGVAWLGLGELLTGLAGWMQRGRVYWTRREFFRWTLAVAAVAALPLTMVQQGTQPFLTGDLLAARLTSLPDGVVAKNFLVWIGRDGITGAVVATCLPLLVLGPALWLLVRRQSGSDARTALAIALRPALVALLLACAQLRWWSLCDGLLLALAVAVASVIPVRNRTFVAGLAGLVFLPGLVLLRPPAAAGGNIQYTRLEAEGLIERAVAHWIADHAGPGGAVVLLPPDRTTSWCFHGGLRGLGTANWENRDGLAATIRIVTATTADEAQALISQRGITHLILPSWDADLDAFARWTLRNPEDAFVMALHHWALPPWLRPLPYNLPEVAGWQGRSVVILEMSGESNRAAALSRLAEYFIETQQLELAADARGTLQRYPADLAALVALAQVEKARGDMEDFGKAFNALVASLAGGFDRTLPWDRRVSLAIVLALGERNDLAREQVRRCLEKIDESRIRSLTTGALFRLQVLGKAFGLQISDPRLRELAGQLLPAELRARL
jgi:hypothetical protein